MRIDDALAADEGFQDLLALLELAEPIGPGDLPKLECVVERERPRLLVERVFPNEVLEHPVDGLAELQLDAGLGGPLIDVVEFEGKRTLLESLDSREAEMGIRERHRWTTSNDVKG